MNKLNEAKKIIDKYINHAECGLFDSHNTTGDRMNSIYNKNGLYISICYPYSYFEVFGLSKDEFNELNLYYNNLLEV